MGAEIGIDFALAHPERVSALVAISGTPSGFQIQGEMPQAVAQMIAALQAGDMESAARWSNQQSLSGESRSLEQMDASLRQRAFEMALIALSNGASMKPDDALTPPAVERLSAVQVPTLVITGSLDHAELHRAARLMSSAIEGARWLNIEHTAHFPSMERPEVFNRAVLEFLAGI
jgi:pimeloyl-ACP methyl ester carboxylesterase